MVSNKLVITISAIPTRYTDLPIDVAIMTEELFRNTLQSTGLSDRVVLYRSIGLYNFKQVTEYAINRKSDAHLLFSIYFSDKPSNFDPVPTLKALQDTRADLYRFVNERLAYNNMPPRVHLLSPSSTTIFARTSTTAFANNCDQTGLQLGSHYTQNELTKIQRYAPTVARASAQALYQYTATTLHLQKRPELPSSFEPYTKVIYPRREGA